MTGDHEAVLRTCRSSPGEVIGRDKGLLAAPGQAVPPRRHDEHEPVRAVWHEHASSLIGAERPDLDAPLLADSDQAAANRPPKHAKSASGIATSSEPPSPLSNEEIAEISSVNV